MLGISQDVTEERSVEARLAYMAMHDALTGLPNRASFADHIQREAAIATAEKPLALLYLDSTTSSTSTTAKGMPRATRCSVRWPPV
ncbi:MULTISPECIES: diguanylate cyclase [unclassified Rhizobium]|uniref:diguanylate cyclase domain-containing protein n=1 Tax=unclassified Rhizobium TaxID=2613769 RepID=UPI002477CEA1|nr:MULTISPECIES: diguanylate cyclase [unclassified Rhizobium]